MAAEPNGPRLRPAGGERVRVLDRAGRCVEVARRPGPASRRRRSTSSSSRGRSSAQVFACVSVYQDRPSVMLLGAASHCSVPYGSKAFGQPFQPGSGAFDPPDLPRADQVRVPEVGAAVEHADGDACAREAGAPGIGEVVRLRIEHGELLQILEVRALERRRLGVRHLALVEALERLVHLLLVEGPSELWIGRAQRLTRLLQLDRADADDALLAGELRQCLHGDLADHERHAARLGDLGVVERGCSRGGVSLYGDKDRDRLGRAALDLLLELRMQLVHRRVRGCRHRGGAVPCCVLVVCGHARRQREQCSREHDKRQQPS